MTGQVDLLNRAGSLAWLAIGLAMSGLGVAYLAATGGIEWQSKPWTCQSPLAISKPCTALGTMMHDIKSAFIMAVAGGVVLLGRWLSVKYAGLWPVQTRFVLTAVPVTVLVAFGFGMLGVVPDLPRGGVFFWLIDFPGRHVAFAVCLITLIECIGVSLTRPRVPRTYAT